MARRPFALGLLLAALAAPLLARAAVPVGLYPLQAEGLSDGERTEVQAIVASALQAAGARGVLEPRSPLVLLGSCKAPITVGCVATLAKGGVVLYAKAKRRGAEIQVTVLFVDAAGRKTKASSFPVDLFIQNLRPANEALASVEAELASGALEEGAPPPAPAVAQPRVASAEPPPPRREPSPPPASAAPPAAPAAEAPSRAPAARPPEPDPSAKAAPSIDLSALPPAQPPGPAVAGKGAPRSAPQPAGTGHGRNAGRWTVGGGVALLAAGAAVGLSGKRLADSLEARYRAGTLRPEDARLYDRVDRYELVANVLLAAGGVVTLAGLTIQATAAPGGAGVAMAGSF